jgi:hypothetical protein
VTKTLFTGVAVCLAGLAGSCTQTSTPSGPTECVPACDGRTCGDDGCGAVCGSCDGDAVCGADGQCRAADACDESCSDLGLTCGDHCGRSCGICDPGDACVDGACACAASCAGKACGDDDGCGQACTPCASDENCSDCALRLHVVDREVVAGVVRSVTVALDYQPPAGAALPGVADIRMRLTGPATLERVGTGQALIDADKAPHADPATGKPFRTLADDSVQILVLSTGNVDPIGAGRWLLLQLRLGADGQPATRPVALELIVRESILAPPAADQLLWSADFGAPVVIWPGATHAP